MSVLINENRVRARAKQNERLLREFPWLWALKPLWQLRMDIVTVKNPTLNDARSFLLGRCDDFLKGYGKELWIHEEGEGFSRTVRVQAHYGERWLETIAGEAIHLSTTLKNIAIVGRVYASTPCRFVDSDGYFDDRAVNVWRLPAGTAELIKDLTFF